ncbi:MAG: hypothetical protein KKF77_16375 [Proteobacteria bacterium]|nr:hypothetical protein [Pseudomonadota bacterium]
MGGKQGQATAFKVVIASDKVRVRKAQPPVSKPMDDRRRKAPRRKPDFLADAGQADNG